MCTLITAARFFLSSVFNNKTMITLMCDGHYLMSNPRILSIFVSLNCFVVLFIGLLLQMNEMKYKLYLLTFLHQWKHRQLIPLNDKNNRKLGIVINLMVKLLMKQGFWPLVVFSSLMFIGSSVFAYFDHKYDFFIPSLVFFNICVVIWILQHYCIVSAGFVAWSVPLFYLKFKFKEIQENIQICIKQNNFNALKNVISQHNSLVIQTEQVNEVFRFVVLILYYVASPGLMLLLYLSHAKDSSPLSRPIFVFLVSVAAFVVFYLNFFCAQISHLALKPRVLMFKFLVEHRLNIRDRIKIMQFIEKLSGSDIGFHCWNLFPMNNYTFYGYVANCACTYFLILEFIGNI